MGKIRTKRSTLAITMEARDSVNLLKGLNSVFSTVCEGAMCEGVKYEYFETGRDNPSAKIRYRGNFKKSQDNLLYFEDSLKLFNTLNELNGK